MNIGTFTTFRPAVAFDAPGVAAVSSLRAAAITSPIPQRALTTDAVAFARERGQEFIERWTAAQNLMERHLKDLTGESRALMQVQNTFFELHRQTELYSRIGETVGEVVRKVQQFGNS